MTKTAEAVLGQIRTLIDMPNRASATDQQLLDVYLRERDESAFAALLQRHGPMVLGVCRRVLRQTQDAEDAFQATFLLLAQQAHSIRKRESLGGWLHGVASRIAQKARVQAARRRQRERQRNAPGSEPPCAAAWQELRAVLDQELGQLPEHYRAPLVLCYLEDRTHEEIAGILGCPLGTVRSRVARGRLLLQKRLTRRGLDLSAVALATALVAHTANASAPAALLEETGRAAAHLAAGEPIRSIAAAPVVALMSGCVRSLWTRMHILVVLLLAVTGGLAGVLMLGNSDRVAEVVEPDSPTAAPLEPPVRNDAFGDALPAGAIARLGTMRFRHEDWVGPFALSPDDRTLAVVADRSLSLWEMSTGKLLQRVVFPEKATALAYAPSGKMVAVGCEDCIVRLIDPGTGKEIRRLVGHQPGPDRFIRGISHIRFIPNTKKIFTEGSDLTWRFWETDSGKELSKENPDQNWARVGTDGTWEARTNKSDPGVVRLLDTQTARELAQFKHQGEVSRVAVCQTTKKLAAAFGKLEEKATIKIWVNPNAVKETNLTGHTAAVFCMAFSADGKLLASGGYDKTVRLWDLAIGKEIQQVKVPTPTYQVAFSRDGKTLLFRGAENRVRLWDIATWREREPTGGPIAPVGALAFSATGQLASASAGSVFLWDLATGKQRHQLTGHAGYSPALAFSADSKKLRSVNVDNVLRTWDPATGKQLGQSTGPGEGFKQVALSPDGVTLAIALDDHPQQVYLWHAETGKEIRRLEVPVETPGVRPTLRSLAFTPDGKTLFAASGTHLNLLRWDVASGKSLLGFGKHDGGLNGVAVAPDGRSVAAVTMDSSLFLWEIASGEPRLVLPNSGYATTVVFSPNSQVLALANNGRTRRMSPDNRPDPNANYEEVRLLRAQTGELLRRFHGHRGGVSKLAFSPDGRVLASGGQDTTIVLWDSTVPSLPPARNVDLAACWTDLSGDGKRSYQAMARMVASPKETVRFLQNKLSPIAVADAKQVAALVKGLDSDQLAERDAATAALKRLGTAAEPELRQAMETEVSVEVRQRIRRILSELDAAEKWLRTWRAVEVLEQIGDADAQKLLRRLGDGAAGARLTQEASRSLKRLR